MEYYRGAKYFASVDLNFGHMQIEISEEDRSKTAYITHEGLFEYLRMPFGLCNAPATFQRVMDMVLSGLKWTECQVYLDDVSIYATTLDELLIRIQHVFDRLKEYGFTVKPKKCVFGVQRMSFLGYIIDDEGVRTDPDKIIAIIAIERPRTITGIRSLIGMASYYRVFIPDFARVVEPMVRLTRKNEEFIWSDEQEKAFDELQVLLLKTTVLIHFDPTLPVELRCDACNYGHIDT